MSESLIAPLDRLARFLREELAGDLPEELRREYGAQLTETERRIVALSDANVPVDRLKLSSRTVRALSRAGIATTDDLARISTAELAALPGMGPQRMHELHVAFFDHRARRASRPGPADVVRQRRP